MGDIDNPLTRIHFPPESGRLAAGATLALPAPAAHHVARVLRLNAGDALALFDGAGGEYAGRIARIDGGSVTVTLGAQRAVEREAPVAVTLAQGISSGERMDYTIQKAVELGVAAVQPLATARSVVRLFGERAERRVAHWRQVAASASEQCGRDRVPEVAPIAALPDWLAGLGAGSGEIRMTLALDAARRLTDMPRAGAVTLAVGAEGGFDTREHAALVAAGFTSVRLGPRILRTETAAVAALAAINALWGDF
jgi:16S rRNA (uracil1498-N3)-methyltransferase